MKYTTFKIISYYSIIFILSHLKLLVNNNQYLCSTLPSLIFLDLYIQIKNRIFVIDY